MVNLLSTTIKLGRISDDKFIELIGCTVEPEMISMVEINAFGSGDGGDDDIEW